MITSLRLPLRLYFIRHGETEWSLSGQHSGRASISLTAHGEDEARTVGQRLRNIPFAHVLTSPLPRAQLGIDKAYGIKKLREILGIELEENAFRRRCVVPGGQQLCSGYWNISARWRFHVRCFAIGRQNPDWRLLQLPISG
jgi:hypothetical protein